MVDAVRDKPQLPEAADMERLRKVSAFLRGK